MQAEQRDAAGNVGRSAAVALHRRAADERRPAGVRGQRARRRAARVLAARRGHGHGRRRGPGSRERHVQRRRRRSASRRRPTTRTPPRTSTAATTRSACPIPRTAASTSAPSDFTVEAWIKPTASDERVIVVEALVERGRAVLVDHRHRRPEPQRPDPRHLLRRDEHPHRVLVEGRRSTAPGTTSSSGSTATPGSRSRSTASRSSRRSR